MTPLRTAAERSVAANLARLFVEGPGTVEEKLENFTKYVRRPHLKRFLALYELFKLTLATKGSIIECGVYRGFSLMAFAKLSAMLEPENLTRRIYGFDSFEGFPSVSERDASPTTGAAKGELRADSHDELLALLREYDADRFLGHIPKVELIRGDMTRTIPRFVETHPHVIVSLLFVDCDLYAPTAAALEHFLPRMPQGAVLAFDDLDNPLWPGETRAVIEHKGLRGLELRRFEWDPYIAYAVLP